MSVESHCIPVALPLYSRWKVVMMSLGVMVRLEEPACCERVLHVGICGLYGSLGGWSFLRMSMFVGVLRAIGVSLMALAVAVLKLFASAASWAHF